MQDVCNTCTDIMLTRHIAPNSTTRTQHVQSTLLSRHNVRVILLGGRPRQSLQQACFSRLRARRQCEPMHDKVGEMPGRRFGLRRESELRQKQGSLGDVNPCSPAIVPSPDQEDVRNVRVLLKSVSGAATPHAVWQKAHVGDAKSLQAPAKPSSKGRCTSGNDRIATASCAAARNPEKLRSRRVRNAHRLRSASPLA